MTPDDGTVSTDQGFGYEPMVFHQRIRLPYRYTAGVAQRAALEGLAAGVLRGSRCEQCEVVLAPARPFCPRCSQATGSVVELADSGVLEAWTTRSSNGSTTTFGMIRPDGADTAMLHVLDVPQERLAQGLRVRARWNADRHGEITDIIAFAVAED
jgi:uncharacterized OB-fold protein